MAAAGGNSKPKLHYFDICGRGELSRLLCAVGEIDFEECYFSPSFDESGGWRQGYQDIGVELNLPPTLPILEHNSLVLYQSAAIETYLSSLSPLFSSLTPAEKGRDMMFAQAKEDIGVQCAKMLFKATDADSLTSFLSSTLTILEKNIPTSSTSPFINGRAYPTMADLSLLIVCKGCMPFQAGMKIADFSISGKYPKLDVLVAAVEKYPAVQTFLEQSEKKTLVADPFGIMKEKVEEE